jgi:hypothetical protein
MFSFLKNISDFTNVNDYLPIITSALLVDMTVLLQIIFGYIKIDSLNDWYKEFGFLAVVADVLSIVIGIIIARFIYPYVFKEYSLITFLLLTCIVQLTHDILFSKIFYGVPIGKSKILDIFKDYANEVGVKILLADSLMMISTIIIASYLANYDTNINIVILIVSFYILPYLLYSIK